MRLAYLLILVPAAIVGVVYLVLFHSLGLQIRPYPFLGAAAAFITAVILVRYYLRRHVKRPGH